MRHLILFTVAILLPVFAFLNFSQNGEDVLDKQAASVVSAGDDLEQSEPKSDSDDSEGLLVLKLPKVFYTEPTNFPSTSNLDSAFF